MKWFFFAFQNTLRNRRRSLVTIALMAIGTAAILMASGFALYTYEGLAQAAARNTGHLVLGTPAQFTQAEDVPLQHGMAQWQDMAQALRADPAVRAVLPSVAFSGLVSNGDKSVVMMALGVDPQAEFSIKGPFLQMVAGQTLSGEKGRPEIMLGEGLARSLKAQPGASLTLLSTTAEGAMNALDVNVAGIFRTGVIEMDKRLLYADLATAQRLLDSPRISRLGVFLADIEGTAGAASRVAVAHPDLTVRTWEDEAPFYRSVRGLYNRIFGTLGAIIALVVIAVVANTMSMSVVERTREIGALRAIGTLPSQLTLSLALEGCVLGAVGALLGGAIALGVSVLLLVLPVQMPPPPGYSGSYPLNLAIDPALYAATVLAMMALALLTSALAARKTVRKPIAQALMHV